MDGLRLDIDNAAMQDMIRQIGATPYQVKLATRRALRRLTNHITTQTKRSVAQSLGITQKALQRRYYQKAVEDGLRIWVGTRGISPDILGTLRQTKTGVRVRRWNFPGAFIADFRGKPRVWIRESSRYYTPRLYSGIKAAPKKEIRAGSRRWPLYQGLVPIHDEVLSAFSGHEQEFADFFLKQFQHELEYAGGKK